jgi:DNA-binding IclR family transcriptional regulator
MTDAGALQPHSQTLSRGIRVLEALSDSPAPLTIAQIAAAIQVHRSIAYRILRTFEDHGLVGRDGAGAFSLAPKMATLARGVERDLQTSALPELTAIANTLTMTAFLVVLEMNECVTLSSVEPRAGAATVAQRPGTRHSLALGAPGIAIQSLLPAQELAARGITRRPLTEGRYATSHDEVIPGLRSVAVPVSVPGTPPAALAVVYVSTELTDEEISAVLQSSATSISSQSG